MIFAIVLLVLTWFVWRYPVNGLSRWDTLGAWGIKVVFGLAFMYIHTRIYGVGDVTVDWEEYMADSITLNKVAFLDFGTYLKFLFGLNSEQDVLQYLANTNHWAAGDLTLMNDSRNVLRINSLLVFVSRGNVYVHVLFFSFFSFIGFREIFNAFKKYVYLSKRLFWYTLFLLPSVGFWTSSVLKEPLMITGLALMLHGLLGDLNRRKRFLRLLIGGLLMLGFKPYVLLCVLAGILVWFVVRGKKKKWLYSLGVAVLFFGGIGVMTPVRQEVTHHLTRKQFDFINVGKGGIHVFADSCFYFFSVDTYNAIKPVSNDSVFLAKEVVAKKVTFGMAYPFEDVLLTPEESGWPLVFQGETCGSFVEVTPIGNSYGQLIKNIPEAFVNAAFRPFFGDPGGKLKYVNILETIALFAFVLFGIARFAKNYSEEQQCVVWLLAVFSISLLVLIGWTTPILGAIVRYRMPAYLILFLIGAIGKNNVYGK